jgi:hypothetical protein
MATVRVRIVILTVRITLSVCPFNCMAHTANTMSSDPDSDEDDGDVEEVR